MKLLENKTALITGGAGGIGRAMAELFCKEGASVVIVDIHEDAGKKAAEELSSDGFGVAFYRCDLSNTDQIKKTVEKIENNYKSLDILCNNAGVELSAPLSETDESRWDYLFAVNVKAMFFLTQNCFNLLKRGNKPSIVNTGSISGLVGWPDSSAYCASKGAVVMLTKQMAVDLAPFGIRVNCVCPGTTDTAMIERLIGTGEQRAEAERDIKKMHLLGRFAEPKEIASAALFLASTEASFITGTILPVDGGYTAK